VTIGIARLGDCCKIKRVASSDPFLVRFWGVRGSIPTPGPATRLIGGNTSCLEVRVGDELLILDAGSGVRGLGDRLVSEGVRKITFLFSHVHWDHILGFPYFRPAAQSGVEIVMHGERKAGIGIDEILGYQAGQAHAPIVVPGKGATLVFDELKPGDTVRIGAATVRVARMNHPDGCVAYRVEHEGRAIVYATDTEHFADGIDRQLEALSQDADLLVYDSMYTADEYRGEIGGSKKGWGHSTWNDGVRLARKAGVKRFALFHHDPSHDDRFVSRLEKEARQDFAGALAAREQMVVDVAGGKVRVPKIAAPAPARAPHAQVARRARAR